MFLVPLLDATWIRKIVASRCDAAPRAPRREARQLNPLPILIARMAHIAPFSDGSRHPPEVSHPLGNRLKPTPGPNHPEAGIRFSMLFFYNCKNNWSIPSPGAVPLRRGGVN